MAVPFIAAILGVLGTVLSVTVALGSFVANILSDLFSVYKAHPFLTVFLFWCLFFFDAFIVTTASSEAFALVGLKDVSLNFSTFFFFIPNLVLSWVFGWNNGLQAISILAILTILLVVQVFGWATNQ